MQPCLIRAMTQFPVLNKYKLKAISMEVKKKNAIDCLINYLHEFIDQRNWHSAHVSFKIKNSSCWTAQHYLIFDNEKISEGGFSNSDDSMFSGMDAATFLCQQHELHSNVAVNYVHFTLHPDGYHELRFDDAKTVASDAPPQDASGGLSIAQQLATFEEAAATTLSPLETWLKQYLPEVADSLQPGATARQLQNYANKLGVVLPQDFVHLYHWHNGQKGKAAGLFYGMHLMSLKASLAACEQERRYWQTYCDAESREKYPDHASSTPSGHIRVQYCNPYWLPFAHDHAGNYLGIDLSPDSQGTAGQVINFGRYEDHKKVLANSLGDFLHWLAAQWQAGNTSVRREADGGRSFNTRWPDKRHFLDSVKLMFLHDGSTLAPQQGESAPQNEAGYLESGQVLRNRMAHMAADELGLTAQSRWQLNIQTGTVTFTTAQGKLLHCQAQILGRYHPAQGQLHWAWDQSEWPLDMLCAARALQDEGTRHTWPRFTTPRVACSEAEAWNLVAAACHGDDVEGLFRATDGDSVLYLGYLTQY